MGAGSRILAKLSKPRLYDAVPRERLFVRLDSLRVHPLVWISSPPGAGKTTLVASWLDDRRIPFLWYQLDAADSDPANFFYYLVELSRQRRGSKPSRLPYLTPEYLPDVPGFTRRFFRTLFASVSAGAVVVLDNCQEAKGDAVPQILAIAAQEIPEGLNLVAISRTRPPTPLACLGANRQLGELQCGELKLTLDESTEILCRDGAYEQEQANELHERANGWAAGLVLLSSYLKRSDAERRLLSFHTQEATFDYFAGEILDRAPSEVRMLLMATALLPQVTPLAAVELTGDATAPAILEDLYRRQYFIDRRIEPELSYRYHDLFREFLLACLHREAGDTEIELLKLRGGLLLAERGETVAALDLLRQGGHLRQAATLILKQARFLIAQGRWRMLQDWVNAFPPSFLDETPWLRYWLGVARMQSDLAQARGILELAHVRFCTVEDRLGQAMCAAAIINAHHYEYNDFAPMDPWIAVLDRFVQAGLLYPDAATELGVYSALVLAGTYRQPRHPALADYVARVSELVQTDLDVNQRVSAAIGLVTYYTFGCDFVRGDSLIATIDPLMNSPGLTALNQAYWWLFVGYYYEQPAGRLAQSRRFYDLADKVAFENGIRQTEFLSRVFRAYSLAGDDPETAQAIIAEAAKLLDPKRAMDSAQLYLAKVFAALASADPATAAASAELGIAAVTKIGAPFFSIAWKASSPAGLIMNGQYALAERWLDEAWAESEGTFLDCIRPLILINRSYLAHLRGQREASLELVRQAIAIGKIRGITYLHWATHVKGIMLAEALKAGIEVEYLHKEIRYLAAKPPAEPLETWPWPVRVYTLGAFRLLVNGRSVEFSHKTPRKPIALLRAVIALGGQRVSERQLADALWSGEEGDSALESLRVTLHRLRKLLGNDEVIRLQEGRLSLNRSLCWTDVDAFESAVDGGLADTALDPVALYKGSFLMDDGDEPWALSARERLRAKFIRYLSGRGLALQQRGEHAQAIACYQRGMEADDLAEEFYQESMRCYMALGRQAEGLAVYRRLRQTLSVVLGVAPSQGSNELFRTLQAANPSRPT